MNILLVEDDTFFQRFYAQRLTERKFIITVANNGEEALNIVKSRPFNLILLDLIMPKVDGFAFLAMRQKDPVLTKIPVIVFSTLGQEQDINKAKSLGANDYMNKSFLDLDSLVAMINKNLGVT